MEKKGTGDGKYGDYTEFLALWTEEDLNDSWLKKEGANNMKTAKRRRTRTRNAFIYFCDVPLWQACSLADH